MHHNELQKKRTRISTKRHIDIRDTTVVVLHTLQGYYCGQNEVETTNTHLYKTANRYSQRNARHLLMVILVNGLGIFHQNKRCHCCRPLRTVCKYF